MGVYDRQIATAKRLIREKGQLVIYRKKIIVPGAKDWKQGNSTKTDYNVSIVFLPNDNTFKELLRYISGSDIPTSNVIGYMGAVPFELTLDDIIITPTQIYNIQSISSLAPNGDIILTTLGLSA